MRTRIFYAIFFTVFASMAITTAIGIGICYNGYESRLNDDLYIELRFLASTATDDPKSLEEINIGQRRITLISPSGEVIYDSVADEQSLENHLDRKEIKDAFTGGAGYDSRSSSSIGEKYIYQALLLSSGNVLRVSAPANTITYFILSVLFPLCICLLIMLIFSIFLAKIIANKITTPINTLDLDNPENIDGYPELTPLLVRISHQQAIIRTQLEEARKRAEEFTLITDNMQEGLVVIDKGGKVLSANSAISHLFQNTNIKTGDSIYSLSRAVAFTSLVSSTLDGKSDSLQVEQGGKCFAIIANPVKSEQGEIAGGVFIFIDVTEKEKREYMRREFTANVSHELKTPLTVISGFAEILKDNTLKEEQVKEYSVEIYTQAQRLISLVHDIIKLSQLDEKRVEIVAEDIKLSEIVNSTIKTLEPKARKADVAVVLNVNEEKTIKGNPSLMGELVFNLLDNAILYNKEGGKVDINITSDDKNLYFTVADSGIGIPNEDIDRVFERFYRVDKSRSRERGGTGLGLSIVRHVAEYHNGTITLKSKLGEGTEITVAFPLV